MGQDPQYVRWKDYFGLALSPVTIYSQQIIDFLCWHFGAESLESIDLGGASTCQDDIINLMNIAFLQDYSKYNPLFKKVKEDMSRDIVFLDLCKFLNTNSINSSINPNLQNSSIQMSFSCPR